ncbi:tetrapyrrole biosynthesis, uroporphyrinogen III synthase [Coniella lustricola]|uniref:Tetrapyrrole biosynthesis, uroporphyrinogen III synthase n=1 Tax=Coniella lustricola TaxID=2025994 RepID=A0A2T3A7Y4_9PEZI|nr:tetrapyrrole biosynthesis, uroporphyrinogen III synthase [Coniella lustricola]
MQSTADRTIPVLLLKTKSSPGDSYEDIFSQPHNGLRFEPTFVPVLEHRFQKDGLSKVGALLQSRKISRQLDAVFGGFIFTSQRAVEAFTQIVQDGQGRGDKQWPHLNDVPVYSVGPATTRALRAVPSEPALQVFGEHTGNGDSLAHFILDHYAGWYSDRPNRNPALLFMVGEQRRDVIPKTLMNPQLPKEKQIEVEEVVVYGTVVMESFAQDFEKRLDESHARSVAWVVVFSPTGCDAMLRGLGLLDETTGKAKPASQDRTRFVATIGPTTRDYLKKTFDFEPDVCAERPSPEGVLEGIKQFMAQL